MPSIYCRGKLAVSFIKKNRETKHDSQVAPLLQIKWCEAKAKKAAEAAKLKATFWWFWTYEDFGGSLGSRVV